MSEVSSKCNRCGAPLPPNAPEGLCPRCLVALNLATQTEVPGETGPPGNIAAKPPPAPPLPPAEVAKLFPQLEILECLGRGGMGAVYKARQPRLDRLVALKILSPEKQDDPKFAERFEREARALARLNHPNIVTVYDFGQVQGNCYLLMEFVDGLTLRQLFHTRKLAPAEALNIVPKICEALQYAHNEGIVHRDIKPENILLDKKGQVKIADFGIAKIIGQTPQGVSLTGAKDVVGTPHYMAPEQIEKPQTVDHRADIYSLGVVFYEMLTGELPLGKFQPPSSCSRGMQIDVRLDEVVLHALEKQPERRYQQASQVKTAVETITGSAAMSPIPKPDHFWRWFFAVVIACLVFIPVAIAILGLLAAIAIPNFVRARQHAQALHEQNATNSPAKASAETWSPTLAPGEKPDLQKILGEAKTLMEQGRYEDALQRHLWYFNHALEYDQGQTGVRLSFALSQWVELGRRYPKAKEALIEIRNRDARMLVEGKGYANLFTDVQAINRELQDENVTYELFKTIREKDPQLAGQCYFWVESLLVAKGEYQWCYDHMGDPQFRFDSIRRSFDMERANHLRMAATQQKTRQMIAEMNQKNGWTNVPSFSPPDTSEMMKKSANDRFVNQTRQLIEILVATGHQADAEKIRDQAVAVLDDARLKSAVSDAEAQVKKVREGSGTASPKTNRYFVTRLNQIIGKAVPGPGYIDPAAGLSVTNAWHTRVELLRQHLEQNPQAGIPELKFLTEYDWLEAAKDDLKTDADYRRALNRLRVAGETHFIDSQLQPALKIYVAANHGQFPSNLAQLQPFFQPPVDEAILQRYEIVPHEKVPDAHWGGDWVVTQKKPVDKDYDRRLVVGAEGGWGRIPF